jgi:hypothetical protein
MGHDNEAEVIRNHIIRLGTHAEKDYLTLARAWYDEVMLNANLVEATAAASAVFLQQLDGFRKPYTIDPMTYVFALNQSVISTETKSGAMRLKRTFESLREKYRISTIPGTGPLTPGRFDTAGRQRFCEAVVGYQADRIAGALEESAEFLALSGGSVSLPPTRILAPYFELSGELAWLDTNIELLRLTERMYPDKAWGVVCLDGLALDNPGLVDTVATAYRGATCNGYMLWLTGFDEPTVTESQVRGLRRLIDILAGSARDRPVINMYGGYFSCLLRFDGLTGISHGVGYGERRALVPAVGGGLPPAKYYFRPVHDEIAFSELRPLGARLRTPGEFAAQICNCPICRGLLAQGTTRLMAAYSQTETKPFGIGFREYPTQEVYRLSRFHFLSNRFGEIGEVNSASGLADLLGQLREANAQYQSLLSTDLRYMLRWIGALSAP